MTSSETTSQAAGGEGPVYDEESEADSLFPAILATIPTHQPPI